MKQYDLKIGDYVVIEYNQRQYATGTVEDVQGGLLFLKDAHEAMPDGSFSTYYHRVYDTFEVSFNEIGYTCEMIAPEKEKKIKAEVNVFKVLQKHFPNTKEAFLFDVALEITKEESNS